MPSNNPPPKSGTQPAQFAPGKLDSAGKVRAYVTKGFLPRNSQTLAEYTRETEVCRRKTTDKAKAIACAALAMVGLYLAVKVATWAVKRTVRKHAGRIKSGIVHAMTKMSSQPSHPARTVRSAFAGMDMVSAKSATNHTHPESAATRSRASTELGLLAHGLGLDPYYVEMSASDQKLCRSGSRNYYWAKDLSAKAVPDSYARDFQVIIDVDYYMDMPHLLATHCVPTALYTFVPGAVSKSTGEYAFTFNKDDTVDYSVSGGAQYSHPVWNYGVDTVVATDTSFMGLWSTSVVYNVDRRHMDGDHQQVLLTPICRTSGPLRLEWFIETPRLRHLRVCETVVEPSGPVVFTRLNVHRPDGLYRSTGIAGTYNCALVAAAIDDAVHQQSCIGKTDLTIAQVKTTTGCADMSSAAVLTRYHRAATPAKPDTVFPVQESVSLFEYSPVDYDGGSKPAQVPFMSPLALGAFVPTISESNDTQSIKGRVLAVKNPELPMSGMLVGFMADFAKALVPTGLRHKAHPVDEEEVFRRQNRPSQQQILHTAANQADLDNDPIRAFAKKESYAKVTDPRNISIVPGRTKLRYSAFLYTLAEHLRTFDWYAFGKTPADIAARVAEVCATASYAVMSDLSRCDGRVSNVARALETLVMMLFFHPSTHAELAELMARQHGQTAYTSTGFRYDTDFTRLSGSSETADFNSILCAFIAYVGYRLQGLSHEQAMAKLGLFGGDDGITADLLEAHAKRAATLVGQVLEYEVAHRHQRGVNFFARYYSPRVWEGEMDSMSDPRRQIIKFHLTGALSSSITARDKLVSKCIGLLVTDPNTPVLGEMAQAVIKRWPPGADARPTAGVSSYWSKFTAPEDGFPNENTGGWMDEEFEHQYPQFDRDRFAAWCASVEAGVASPLCPPLCAEDKAAVVPPADVVADDDLVFAKATEPTVPPASDGPEEKYPDPTPECKHYAAGKCSYGAKCRQRHVGNVSQDNVACGTFRKTGKCKFGAKCKFKHVSSGPPAQTA